MDLTLVIMKDCLFIRKVVFMLSRSRLVCSNTRVQSSGKNGFLFYEVVLSLIFLLLLMYCKGLFLSVLYNDRKLSKRLMAGFLAEGILVEAIAEDGHKIPQEEDAVVWDLRELGSLTSDFQRLKCTASMLPIMEIMRYKRERNSQTDVCVTVRWNDSGQQKSLFYSGGI